MKKNSISRVPFFLCLFLYTTTVHCNVVWPAAFVAMAIYNSVFLVTISIVVEALFFYWLIKNITYSRALLVSCVGNAASTLVGTLVMTIAMLLWHITFDMFLGGTLSIYNFIATYILMYLGSGLIEFLAIKIFFRYSFKQVWIPILIGNLTTYALVALFTFKNNIMMLLGI